MECSTSGFFPCPLQSPGACSDACSFSQWYHPTISSSVVPFSCLPSFPALRSFLMSQLFPSSDQSIGWCFSISPSNEYSGLMSFRIDWFDLFAVQGTQESSPTPQFKSINSSTLSFLYSPTLISIHDYRKSNRFDESDVCWQSNISAF